MKIEQKGYCMPRDAYDVVIYQTALLDQTC